MLKQLIHARFPGCMVITIDQKTLTPDLYDKSWPKFLRNFLSIEFQGSENIERQLFSTEIENLQIVILGNGISKTQDGKTNVIFLDTIFLVPNEEVVFSIYESKKGISYARRESSSCKFKEVKNVPKMHSELQKFIINLFKESGIIIS